jgi:hypothetical protein
VTDSENSPAPAASLIERLRRLAWDVDFTDQTIDRYPEWVLARVLDFGQWEDFEALARHFGLERVRSMMKKAHCTTARADAFCKVLTT